MGRGPLPPRGTRPLSPPASGAGGLIRYYPVFPRAVPVGGARHPRVTHQSAALAGAEAPAAARRACLRRAASVRSEPGSNSPSLFQPPETGGRILFRPRPPPHRGGRLLPSLVCLLGLKEPSAPLWRGAVYNLPHPARPCQHQRTGFPRFFSLFSKKTGLARPRAANGTGTCFSFLI